MASSGRSALRLALAGVIALTALGTALWIAGVLRPAPPVAAAPVVARHRDGTVTVFAVALPKARPFDALGATVRALGIGIASGRMPLAGARAVAVEAADPALRLVFDPGILSAGVVSGQSADHLLGLAGAGSRWPDARAAYAYCGRLETSRGVFCDRVRATGAR